VPSFEKCKRGIKQQDSEGFGSALNQATRQSPDKYTDTKPSVIEKELAEGQLYQLQEFAMKQQEKARPQEEAQTNTQTPSQV
jgi:hypothetical protein